MTVYFKPKPTGGCVIVSDIRSDQETGEGPVDPNTPASSSEVPADEQQSQPPQPKSPDEAPGDEPREGGTPTHEKGSTGGDDGDDEDED